MKVPISKRLLCCADLVPQGTRLADIGTDHGYLGIYLLLQDRVQNVVAADVRPMPLENARQNARRFGMESRMDFRLSNGLEKLGPEDADAIVCAGMGGDLIVDILTAASWLKDSRYALILQPQSAGQCVRLWLAESGFCLEAEKLVEDAGFLYTVLRARYDGVCRTLEPGEQYVSRPLLTGGSPLLSAYLDKLIRVLSVTVDGLQNAEKQRPERRAYYETALEQIEEMRKKL